MSDTAPLSLHAARTILIVDDHELVRELVECVLSARGFNVVMAEDGPAAVEFAADNPVDAVLTDMDLPRMNGVDVCRALRRIAEVQRRPFLAWLMSGFISPELVARARAAGARGVLLKPIPIQELLARIEELFSPSEQPQFAA